ncbi:MAG TPA: hypothetical protein K8V56_00960 [Sporosarcina psychrophila]|uniref:Uncharacterized protein n=1 Tax=Sporosarcina psychrophila TaxID=1476 RepID=A0A921FWP0_SPOPS|nr:hypothetical protein [Jeotgalicoccus aerolatus]HJF30332.1 hypothetical protein [Sporosarcina psychrophila]HJG32109.1 hypothetical protein [Jeotgalicoccus aerolatus]
MITIGAVLLIVLTYALVTAVNFFKDTELSKEAKEKMLDKSFRAAFITVIAGWIVFEMLMVMRIDPSFEIYRLVMLGLVIISFIVFGLNLRVQNHRPD